MNQQTQLQEQIQANMVQALWIQGAISVLITIGVICYFVADVIKAAMKVKEAAAEVTKKEVIKK